MSYKVFISFKRNALDGSGVTRDYELAADLHRTLKARGIVTFFSEKDLSTSDFREEIDEALDEAQIMVVVGTKIDHLESKNVKYEWRAFYEDILNGRKTNGQIYTLLEGVKQEQLPRALRLKQSFFSDQKETLVKFIMENLGMKDSSSNEHIVQQSTPNLHAPKAEQKPVIITQPINLLNPSLTTPVNYQNQPIHITTKSVTTHPEKNMPLILMLAIVLMVAIMCGIWSLSNSKGNSSIVKNDSQQIAESQEYEESYVSSVISQAEELLAAKDYDGADELINAAKKQYQNNSALDDESKKIALTRPVTSKDIMQILSSSVLQQSGTYKAYLGSNSINAFAEDQYNAFSINTAASYNMWGGGVQNVSFKISEFTFDTLTFTICGETGTSGSVTIDVYLDHSVEDDSPDYSFNLNDAPYPVNAIIDVSGKTTLAFKVTNHAGHENRIVFYNFEGT